MMEETKEGYTIAIWGNRFFMTAFFILMLMFESVKPVQWYVRIIEFLIALLIVFLFYHVRWLKEEREATKE